MAAIQAARTEARALRIAVHDFGGYAFASDLSREFARRGHQVRHLYCSTVTAPRGALVRRPGDAETVEFVAVAHARPFEKYSAPSRIQQEWEYGAAAGRAIVGFQPDVIVSANTPLLSQRMLHKAARQASIPFIYWLQDLLGVGIRNVLARRSEFVASVVGGRFQKLEERILSESDAVIAISDDFRLHLERRGVAPRKTHVIENWAPLADVTPRDPQGWRRAMGLDSQRIVLYSGTLGHKHDPALLLNLAVRLRGEPAATVVVASDGLGARWLADQQRALGLSNLRVIGFQPYEDLADMLAAADILLVLLHADAGVFSVPSKVLTGLSAGRPLVAAVPADNRAAVTIAQARAGVVVEPGDSAGFAEAVHQLLNDAQARAAMSAAGRAYAQAHFDIGPVADRFLSILHGVMRGGYVRRKRT